MSVYTRFRLVLLLLPLGVALPVWADVDRRDSPTTEVKRDDTTITLDIGGGVKMEMARIRAGKFLMGSPDSDKDAIDNEKPQHEVTISKDFYLGKYLVTQEQYAQVMGENDSYFSKKGKGKDAVAGLNMSRFPVERVSWEDAQEFCNKVSDLTKRRVELPTEAQWEYACRAGKTTRCFCGDDVTIKDANFDTKVGRTTKVGEYPANAWGLCDMAGNVWQWCADGDRKYTADECADPVGPLGDHRVLRGGSWFLGPRYCRAAFRLRHAPGFRNYDVGFRVAIRLD